MKSMSNSTLLSEKKRTSGEKKKRNYLKSISTDMSKMHRDSIITYNEYFTQKMSTSSSKPKKRPTDNKFSTRHSHSSILTNEVKALLKKRNVKNSSCEKLQPALTISLQESTRSYKVGEGIRIKNSFPLPSLKSISLPMKSPTKNYTSVKNKKEVLKKYRDKLSKFQNLSMDQSKSN